MALGARRWLALTADSLLREIYYWEDYCGSDQRKHADEASKRDSGHRGDCVHDY